MKVATVVIIWIGEDVGASIYDCYYFKQMILTDYGRAINALMRRNAVLSEVDAIIHPERSETAQTAAQELDWKGVFETLLRFSTTDNIVEEKCPKYIGLTIVESNIRDEFSPHILSTIKMKKSQIS